MDLLEPTLDHAVNDLRCTLDGNAYLPGEEGYAESSACWNLTVQHRPAVIVAVRSEADVQNAIRFARKMNLPIAVQATGHGQFKTCDGGVLLNVSSLDRVEIDPQAKTATIGGGTKWGKVIELAAEHNLMPISGSSPTVGVVGYTLGGGYGLLSRKYGLGVDQVVSMRLVDPTGAIRIVSESENADVFSAILGGGGSFGVVTQIEVRLHSQPPILGGTVMFDASLADQVYSAYLKFTKECPEEVTSALTMMTFPPVPFIPEFLHGRSMLIFSATALAELTDAEELLSPIRNLPGAEFDAFRPMTYADTHAVYNDPIDPMPATIRGALVRDLDEDTLRAALEAVGPAPKSENLVFRIRHYGGAATRGGEVSTSVGQQRQAEYLMYFLGVAMGPITLDQMHAQAERVFTAIEPAIVSRGPLNWLGEGNVTAEEVKATFGPEDLARQLAVKAEIDPENRFRYAGVGLD